MGGRNRIGGRRERPWWVSSFAAAAPCPAAARLRRHPPAISARDFNLVLRPQTFVADLATAARGQWQRWAASN